MDFRRLKQAGGKERKAASLEDRMRSISRLAISINGVPISPLLSSCITCAGDMLLVGALRNSAADKNRLSVRAAQQHLSRANETPLPHRVSCQVLVEEDLKQEQQPLYPQCQAKEGTTGVSSRPRVCTTARRNSTATPFLRIGGF